ncbi:MAG: hypothetical protein STSR0001_08130 [Methanothrix sp.]
MIEQIDFEDLPISELKAAKTAKGKGMKILYISCVGSHMWGMESKESDIDLVMIYTVSTRRILRGEKFPAAIRQEMAAKEGGKANLCRESYHSIKGMAESQIKSETGQLKLSGAGLVKRPGKGYRTALRSINFGIELLREARISYEPVMHDPTPEELKEGMNQLDEAYRQSMLPDLPDEDQFRDFLLGQRLKEMDEDAGKD